MPTASTSQILGNSECFEPYTSNLYSHKDLRIKTSMKLEEGISSSIEKSEGIFSILFFLSSFSLNRLLFFPIMMATVFYSFLSGSLTLLRYNVTGNSDSVGSAEIMVPASDYYTRLNHEESWFTRFIFVILMILLVPLGPALIFDRSISTRSSYPELRSAVTLSSTFSELQ
ncbi:unnamed protein product [Arabis nemorensis]|uniref:Ribonucleotide reductase large subunit C-terminal domain-containing protein n=1 Tax=Arabis nemorensis TaxID=586526 RepID=A0A565BM88_9BRAS|nr:unnamed protein product [Arabis nemorensis]